MHNQKLFGGPRGRPPLDYLGSADDPHLVIGRAPKLGGRTEGARLFPRHASLPVSLVALAIVLVSVVLLLRHLLQDLPFPSSSALPSSSASPVALIGVTGL